MTDLTKDALEYAVRLAVEKEVIYQEQGKTYYDSAKATLKELDGIKYAEPLTVRTLTSLVSFLKEKFDNETDVDGSKIFKPLLVQIQSPTQVKVLSQLDADRKRECLIQAEAQLNQFNYGRFMDSEKFIINILSLFIRDDNSEMVREYASAIRIEGGSDLTDNGVSQTATVKTGAATVEKVKIPSPVELRPYRTFLEIDQPTSPFVFRIDKLGDCALFEADGGMWRHVAVESLVEYLSQELQEEISEGYLSIIG